MPTALEPAPLPPVLVKAGATPAVADAITQIRVGATALRTALTDLDARYPRLNGALAKSWIRLAQHAITTMEHR